MSAITGTPVPETGGNGPHWDEICSWRGRCMNLYARSDEIVCETLMVAEAAGHAVDLTLPPHEQLGTLRDLAEAETGGNGKRSNVVRAIDAWTKLGARRPFVVNGVVTALMQNRERWHARFDSMVGEGESVKIDQWIADKIEAEAFEEVLDAAYTLLSVELEQFQTHFGL
ncbi:hypothetical protein [Croceicoccus bisphenolivorans]|uniref:hypothetical protein n=1 Tax=Croceicoccus bisphenolivorans TaxID=1783232 RepID=UPI00082A6DDF|nr:hypothetical protein [Croceicoccus bisphenolivorans]